MSFRVLTIPPFDSQLKRLIRKHPSLKKEIAALGEQLSDNPTIGTSLGRNCYKIRLAIASKGKGKSGGARVITNVYVSGEIVFLLSIYDKSEKADLDQDEMESLLSKIAR